ncbi:hypothetical protein C8J56DRAFT_1045387 [Mycena floridula]|nr:hypothetical protein C8J56DRAFT_1045387 [Mycena floridula]
MLALALDFMPIHFMHKRLAFDELCALYAVSDLLLISLRVSYGRCTGSIVVNPWDSQQVANAIHEAVTLDASTRAENHRKLFKYVNKYSAAFWGSSFIKEMSKIDTSEVDKEGQAELKANTGGTVITNGTVKI